MTTEQPVDFDRVVVRDQMASFLNDEDVRELCFDLRIDHESLPGDSKRARIREVIVYAERVGITSSLLSHLKRIRPEVTWGVGPQRAQESVDLHSLLEFRINGYRLPSDKPIRQQIEWKVTSSTWGESVHYGSSKSFELTLVVHNVSSNLIENSLCRLAIETTLPLVPSTKHVQSVVIADGKYICNLNNVGTLYPDEWKPMETEFSYQVSREQYMQMLPKLVVAPVTDKCNLTLIAYTITNPIRMPFEVGIVWPDESADKSK